MLAESAVLVLFLLSAVAVTTRALRVSEGWWPLLAGGLAVALGLVPLAIAARGLGASLDVLAFFAGLLLWAWALRLAGAIAWLLDRIEGWAGTDRRRLLLAVMAATALVSALLSNDAAALLLAPELLSRLQRRGLALPPFAIAVALSANAASTLLPISNPVNLLILDRAGIPLASYLPAVTPAGALALLLTLGVSLPLLVRWLPQPLPPTLSLGPRAVRSGWPVGLALLLGLLVATDVGFGAARLPIGPPTLAAGVLAILLAALGARRVAAPRGLGWSVLAMVAGFSVLASGLARSAWLARVSAHLVVSGAPWVSGLCTGLASALVSGVVNNLPAALLITAGLQGAHRLGSLVFPAIVGADLGPNLAPFGSLSTILILAAARSRGEPVPLARLLQLGLVVGPVALLPAITLSALLR